MRGRAVGGHRGRAACKQVLYGAKSLKMTVGAFVRELQAAGVGSLPGTSAEILDDALRDEIAPGRLSSAEWLDVRGCNNHNKQYKQ
jgi:2-iminoacetate synthase ThiH